MVQGWWNHWKTIDANGALEKKHYHPIVIKSDHRWSLFRSDASPSFASLFVIFSCLNPWSSFCFLLMIPRVGHICENGGLTFLESLSPNQVSTYLSAAGQSFVPPFLKTRLGSNQSAGGLQRVHLWFQPVFTQYSQYSHIQQLISCMH